jgi:DNA-directed RNA polymerase specialized sigma subunit
MELEDESLSQMSFKQSKQLEHFEPEMELEGEKTHGEEGEKEEEEKEEEVVVASRCINERQRQIVVAMFGIGLSGLMTCALIILLNKIKG